jgi:hypothetical protein
MRNLELTVNLPVLHTKQEEIKFSRAKRKVIRAGRRGGKTTLAADIAVDAFLDGCRVLYATPTQEQIDRFWFECKNALKEPLEANVYYKNETRHIIELEGTEQRIRGKTAWNADTLRGDYGDEVLLDEFQDMDPDALDLVVFPMLLDNDGNLTLIYTKKRGKKGKYASDLYTRAEEDKTGRWGAFTFTSHDNPHLSKDALSEITQDMTNLAYRMEIMAEDIGDDPNALWNRELINENRVLKAPELIRVVVGVDPPGGQRTECGIVVAGSAMVEDELHAFVIDDPSLAGSPGEWGNATVTAYHRNLADRVLGEANYGGDMVESTIRAVDPEVSYKAVRATRGKAVRAEPVVAQYERGKVHHVGEFGELEDEMCNWVPESGMLSPNRLDALVWAIADLLGEGGVWDVY